MAPSTPQPARSSNFSAFFQKKPNDDNLKSIEPIWSDLSTSSEIPQPSAAILQPVIIPSDNYYRRSSCSTSIKWLIAISLLVGIIGCIVGGVGIAKWQALRKEIDRLHDQVTEFSALNAELSQTNTDLKGQVDRLDEEITKFSQLSDSIREFVNHTGAAFDEVLDTAHSLFTDSTKQLENMAIINEQTKAALQEQLNSEARERELTYITIANTVELSDGQQGFTESEWNLLAQRITSVPGSSYADAQSFLAAHPFGSLKGPDGTISDEEVGQILLQL